MTERRPLSDNPRPRTPADAGGHLARETALGLLRAGPTYAAEVIGDVPPPFLEALVAGLAPGFSAAVTGDNNRVPRALAGHGGDVRVALLPAPDDRHWWLKAFTDDGILQVTGLGTAFDRAGRPPPLTDRTASLPNFGLLAPFDGVGFATSWERHPRRLRAEYVAMARHPERYWRRFGAELWLLPRVKLAQSLLALTSGLATALCLLRGLSIPFGLFGILSGLLSMACHLYVRRVVRRLERFTTLPVDFWRN